MKCASVLLLIGFIGGTWRLGQATCVLESDFGFVINCAFKKSGLFRVRNLGGVKAHVGIGFSLGDELGFKESLSNTDANRRRSSQASKFQVAAIQAQQSNPIVRTAPPPIQSSIISSSKPLTNVPPFKPIPPALERPTTTMANISIPQRAKHELPKPYQMGIAIPSSISRLSTGPTIAMDPNSPTGVIMSIPKSKSDQLTEKITNQNFAIRTLPIINNDLPPPLPQTNSNSIQSLLATTNITEALLEAALIQRHQLLLQQQQQQQQLAQHITTTTSTTTTTTTQTSKPNKLGNIGKVMNAPKEYYPVGYDKNFDDNFASRVELPETSFYCGDQKHFPGLYADEDLGCMVFHVCALTDDGLIMKSFLCPESTLFDQTILKCNWWFYVDCKNSKKLYDSNIPISKSYQLMKALTFFSSYRKDATEKSTEEEKD